MVELLTGAACWIGLLAGFLRWGAADADDRPAQRALSGVLAFAIAQLGLGMHYYGAQALYGGWRWGGVVLLIVAPALVCTAAGFAYDALRR